MNKAFLLAATFAFALPALAKAETLEFPSEAPIAKITIPHSWGPKETETGVDATSDDSAVYFSIDLADEKSSDQVIKDAIDFLTKNGVEIDPSTRTKDEDSVVNGMDMVTTGWQGKDSDGAVDIQLGVVQPNPDKLLVLTYWGSKDTEAKHDSEIAAMIQSLMALK